MRSDVKISGSGLNYGKTKKILTRALNVCQHSALERSFAGVYAEFGVDPDLEGEDRDRREPAFEHPCKITGNSWFWGFSHPALSLESETLIMSPL